MKKDTRKRYKCDCSCENVFYATKSLAQCMGKLDAGHGSCPKCKTFYNLTLDEENDRMILTRWEKYIEKIKSEE